MAAVLDSLQPFGYPVVIVDDGSDTATQQVLQQLAELHPNTHLVTLATNQGKGAAVIQGIHHAQQLHCSHAIQIDADGQHDIAAIPQLIACSRQHPQQLISGRPIYDDSVPKSRLYGRYITHVWVWIETLSLKIQDSMCGFRSYPVAATLDTIAHHHIGLRMDFDTEIFVKMYWRGYDCQFVPTRVFYPQDGISHFDAWHDNIRISKMHTRLFLGMLPRIPSLIARHFK